MIKKKKMNIDILKLNNEILNNIQLTSQEYLILKSFESFYQYNDNIQIFYNLNFNKYDKYEKIET